MFSNPFRVKKIRYCLAAASLAFAPVILAGPLNTKLPDTINLPAQPLAESLKQYARQSGNSIAFDSKLVQGKTAPAVKGDYEGIDAVNRILNGSGLEAVMEEKTIVIKRERVKNTQAPKVVETNTVNVRAKRFHEIGPLPGLGLTKEQIPGNVQSITAKEIKESHSLSLTDLLNKKLQSVNVNDYQGNPFQMDVTYRGFTAGPQIGTPQGLSVFLDGIRVNEPFGDVVNWDMIPMNAIAGVDVFPGSNPIFGLNTLGGAFTLKTKDGFNNEGVDAEVLTGSYGRKQLQVEGGINNGEFALFGAGNFFLEDGWRDNSPSKVNQFFGKASYRGEKLDLNLSTLFVKTDLVGNGLLPSEQYAQDPTSVFTSPDTTKNRLAQFQFSSAFQVNDNFSITGQVYRRNSKRHQIGADVFTDWDELKGAKLVPPENDGYTCMFKSTQGGDHPNLYGIPDYLVIPVNRTLGENIATVEIFNDWLNNNGVVDLDVKYAPFKNLALPDNFVAGFKDNFNKSKNFYEQFYYNRGSLANPPPTGEIDFDGSGFPQAATAYGNATFGGPQALVGAFEYYPNENILMTAPDNAYFSEIRPNGDKIQQVVIFLAPVNNATCRADPNATLDFPGPYNTLNPNTGFPYLIDGFAFGEPGYVEGTPTAVITDNQINQLVNGASIQFNWNFEQHKFMVGASIDSANAEYANTQQLGFLNANRKAFLAPDLANPQFSGADTPLANNDFSGNNITKSVYFSETWSPTEQWHFNASGRYNDTHGKNKIAARYGFGAFGIGDALAVPDEYEVCKTDEECLIPRNYRPLNTINQRVLDPAETEKFSYYSFNPSLGVTWQAKENLNLFANWAKGTRTPSVIELGCAFDKTPTNPVAYTDAFGNFHPQDLTPKSISENRSCSLPTALSGDPYLPQIKSTSYDVGARGSTGENLQWNLGAYQTDLKDDLYFITAGNQQGFFDTIGKTRRRGLEAGISVKQDKLSVGFNYSLTDATFQDNFLMLSADNSSSFALDGYGSGVIQVKKGNRMPGVPLHNLNASISYEMTDKWTVGLSSVVHSESFVRGNENNKHRVGVAQARSFVDPVLGPITVYRQPSTNPGKVPGYATFNFQTSYKFNKEWTASMLINNVFDKEYFSAGRLGRNPFSPSIAGAIGPDGYNHNSGDWLSTNFIAPGAPRAAWFALRYEFSPDKK